MADDKDIRFAQKKIDESWKDQIAKERGVAPNPASSSSNSKSTSKPFMEFLTSLGYQAMIHLGEIPFPGTGQKEPNPAAAKEIIDLLAAIKEKTEGNLSKEEAEIFQSVLPELQMKFAQIV